MCAYKLVLCDKVCNLALPRGILKDHNCATSLKAVYLKIKQENEELKDADRILRKENKTLLGLVEKTANRIQNMEEMIQA